MAHRHLILAYVLTWAIQLAYLGKVAMDWHAEKRAGRIES